MALILSQDHLRQILEHAQAEAPREACGLLAGTAERVVHVLPAANVAENPTVAYLMDPQDQIRHFLAIDEQALELLGIYHSHPASPAYPSPTDLSMAYYPEAVYLIVSLMPGAQPVLGAYHLVNGQINEVGLRLVSAEVTGD